MRQIARRRIRDAMIGRPNSRSFLVEDKPVSEGTIRLCNTMKELADNWDSEKLSRGTHRAPALTIDEATVFDEMLMRNHYLALQCWRCHLTLGVSLFEIEAVASRARLLFKKTSIFAPPAVSDRERVQWALDVCQAIAVLGGQV